MKLRNIFLFFAIAGVAIWGCSKSSDSTPTVVDYASNASGTYTGTVLDTIAATVVINKQASATVVLHLSIPSQISTTLDYAGVAASDGGSGKILLSLPTGTTPISGTVTGKSLDCYFKLLHFVGTKP